MKNTLSITLFVFFSAAVSAQYPAFRETVKLNWELEYSLQGRSRTKTAKARVPGAVQLDIAAAEGYGDYYFGENWKDYLWMEEQFFSYKTTFAKPEVDSTERLVFVSKGIDYAFEILLNGEKLLHQEGMFTPVELDLTDKVRQNNELRIRILPAPKMQKEPTDHTQAAQSVKPAMSYGWDMHPRLIPSGIWDETYLAIKPLSHINDAQMRYRLSENLRNVKIDVTVAGANLQGNNVIWKLRDQNDKIIIARVINPDSDEILIGA
ncbi:MAG: hypothetical protein LC655_05435, partial [Bacteroidales bacterium]|nr:hypothetical protein [Bacteroidales bacterium]